jgi:CRISPR-associated endonuclease Csn1
MQNKKYYLGLDIGTDSVGYAVTDEYYRPIKFKGEPMLGVHVFESRDEDSPTVARRAFRTARRRLDRRRQRVQLVGEILAPYITETDPNFFIRIRESGLCAEDKLIPGAVNVYFNDPAYKDKDYYRQYPTVHHLINELMYSREPHDVRLVYIACAWLVAHRGHFLNDLEMDRIDEVTAFEPVYDALSEYLESHDIAAWDFGIDGVADIL